MGQEVQLVVFKLMQADAVCEYAVPIIKVQEIIQGEVATRIPQSPDFVEGIISLRGKIIPIVNMKKRLNVGSSSEEPESCSVVVEVEGNTVGIMVDEVCEVLRLDTDNIDPPPAVVHDISVDYLIGIGKISGRLVLLLDVDNLFSDRERAELSDFANSNQ